ncbi:hypothetical protein [Streptomyces sp. RKAG293]|uniref:hypothetical protein n=1 Tax=Streptomyces sp. RKAG293 TaxID=2893403 RepID=UPI002034173C|nr:hypothetical protein [Streptomyces sp. RKAG293]MCM2416549.1 hypothetical protein [Streptomyces sp. RKAG293]
MERELAGRIGDHGVLLTTKGGRYVCIAPTSEQAVLDAFFKLGGDVRVALGRPHGPRRWSEVMSRRSAP